MQRQMKADMEKEKIRLSLKRVMREKETTRGCTKREETMRRKGGNTVKTDGGEGRMTDMVIDIETEIIKGGRKADETSIARRAAVQAVAAAVVAVVVKAAGRDTERRVDIQNKEGDN
jgi:hypothetical protein